MDPNISSLEYTIFSSEWQVYKYCNSIVEMMKGDDGLESSAIRSKPLMG